MMHDTRCWRHHNLYADCTCDELRRLDQDYSRCAVIEAELRALIRVCHDEANRLANHCSDGAAKWAMDNLYHAAIKAETLLDAPNAEVSDSRREKS